MDRTYYTVEVTRKDGKVKKYGGVYCNAAGTPEVIEEHLRRHGNFPGATALKVTLADDQESAAEAAPSVADKVIGMAEASAKSA